MKLFPASASLDPLMEALVRAFEAPSHQPLSRSEESRRDAFGALCDELARDGARQRDPCFENWLAKRPRECWQWFCAAAWDEDEDQISRARDAVMDEFVSDCGDDYAERARIRQQELADEDAQAANEARL